MPKAQRTVVVEFTPKEVLDLILAQAAEVAKCSPGTPSRIRFEHEVRTPSGKEDVQPNLIATDDDGDTYACVVDIKSATVTFTN